MAIKGDNDPVLQGAHRGICGPYEGYGPERKVAPVLKAPDRDPDDTSHLSDKRRQRYLPYPGENN